MTEEEKKEEQKKAKEGEKPLPVGRQLPDLEVRYSKYRLRLKKLTLMSDILSRNVLKDKRCTEHILQIILKDKELNVIDQKLQADYKNLHGRGAVLDCLVVDGRKREFNVELQQDNEGAHPKRARYHLGLMDTNILEPGQDFDQLPESYVIFITQKDALGSDLPILHINRIIEETGQEFGDQSHFIYVDASKQDQDTELGRLMHDLNCRDAADMQKGILAERVRWLKETERGVEHMCREMDEIYNEAFGNGKAEGRTEEKVKVVQNMKKLDMPIEQIALVVNVDIKTVKEWLGKELVSD